MITNSETTATVTFPHQKLQSSRSVAWLRSEVEAWIASRPRK
ncbi:helix-turn-helix transcriptional regulator [Burkholderia sp. LMU1-1-1.1]